MPENSAVSSKNAAPQFLVQGVVSDRARRPAGSMTVTAFDQDLRTRQQLGRSRTNANGEFRIDYTSVQFKRAEQGGADLVLEVRSQADELLHTTATHFHAPPKLTIDITLASRGGEAEFDRILRELTPLLEGQDVELTTLEEMSCGVPPVTFGKVKTE